MKKKNQKIMLHKETLRALDMRALDPAAAGV